MLCFKPGSTVQVLRTTQQVEQHVRPSRCRGHPRRVLRMPWAIVDAVPPALRHGDPLHVPNSDRPWRIPAVDCGIEMCLVGCTVLRNWVH